MAHSVPACPGDWSIQKAQNLRPSVFGITCPPADRQKMPGFWPNLWGVDGIHPIYSDEALLSHPLQKQRVVRLTALVGQVW